MRARLTLVAIGMMAQGGQPTNVGAFTYKNLATSDTPIQQTAVKWIKDPAEDDKPFFLSLSL
jgi:hypothetical protein